MNNSAVNEGNYITKANRRFSYFAGNNYLGLSNQSEIVEEAICAIKNFGINFAASRLTTGTSDLHLALEKTLAEYKGRDDAIVFATGYLGNSLLLQALKQNYSSVLMDSMAHPSILDGIPKDIAKIDLYNHCDTNHLESLLKKVKQPVLIITDGIFALTGEIAPLDDIYTLAKKYDAILIVDDAHATGILGEKGRGTPEYFRLDNVPNLYQSETMSKALGAYGGFISSCNRMIKNIRSNSTFYGASTALPPPLVAAGLASVRYLQNHPELREKLKENVHLIKNGIRDLEFPVIENETPIIPLFFNKKNEAQNLSSYLEENQIIAPYIEYPSKMEKYTVRMTVSASHSTEQIENLISVLKNWIKHAK